MKPSAFRFVPFESHSHYDFFSSTGNEIARENEGRLAIQLGFHYRLTFFLVLLVVGTLRKTEHEEVVFTTEEPARTPLGNMRGESFLSILFE